MAPDDDPLAAFEREQALSRRRRRVVVAAVLATCLLAVALVWRATRNAPASLDRDRLASVRAGLESMRGDPSRLRAFAAAALADLESQRLPAPLVRAFASIENVPPGFMRDATLARALLDPALTSLWIAGCPAGPRALATAMSVSRSEAAEFFCRTCHEACARLGGPPPEASAAAVAATALAADHLERTASLDPLERELLRAVASSDGP